MKKIILSIAILASGVSTYAMSNNTTPVTPTVTVMNEEFTEIATSDLPEAVTNAVKKDYSTATIDKAYVNASGQYKLDLSENGAVSVVFIDKDGNWLEASAVK